jgi:hypothetical protein
MAAPDQDFDDTALGRVEPSIELLHPPEWADPSVDKLSVAFSRAVFDGWVRQPSPCCAAASVAGATNAALGLRAADAEALSHAHIAGIMHGLLAEQAAKRRATVERLLGGAAVEPAIQALRELLATEGRSLGGRKESGCKPKEALAKIRALCATRAAPEPAVADDATTSTVADATTNAVTDMNIWAALRDIFPPASAESSALDGPSGDADGERDDADEADDDLGGAETLMAGLSLPGSDADRTLPGSSADWTLPGSGADDGLRARRELRGLLAKLAGMEQLSATSPRLSTAMIGNWGITGAVSAMRDRRFLNWHDPRLRPLQQQQLAPACADEEEERPRTDAAPCADDEVVPLARVVRAAERIGARTLASVRLRGTPAPPIVLSKHDSAEEIELAWRKLRGAFVVPASALLLHHRNHYALIFAMREWWCTPTAAAECAEPQPERVRQILTARKGQRPTTWMDWTEVHSTLSGWAGYAIIEISASRAAAGAPSAGGGLMVEQA